MAHILIEGHPVLSFETEPYREKYWNNYLSSHISKIFGKEKKSDNLEVEEILTECFIFFTSKFKELVNNQDSELFYYSVFILHEESILLYIEQLKGYELPLVIQKDFSMYRRILKLILEQGCDIEIHTNKKIEQDEIINLLQELYYLGYWMYTFADEVAIQKMIPNAKFIEFEHDIFTYGWQNDYDTLYHKLMQEFSLDYETFFDEKAPDELKDALEMNFSIKYDKALGIIEHIKKYFRFFSV